MSKEGRNCTLCQVTRVGFPFSSGKFTRAEEPTEYKATCYVGRSMTLGLSCAKREVRIGSIMG